MRCSQCRLAFCWACMQPSRRCSHFQCANGAPHGNASMWERTVTPPALPLGTPPPHHTPVLGLLPRSDRLHACPNMNACPSPALGLLHVPRMCSDAPHTHLAHQPTRTCRPHDSSQVTSVLYLVAGGHGWGPNPNPNPNPSPNPNPLPSCRWRWMGTAWRRPADGRKWWRPWRARLLTVWPSLLSPLCFLTGLDWMGLYSLQSLLV